MDETDILIDEINDLANTGSNATCADCGENGCTFISSNLGIFLCYRCSELHKSALDEATSTIQSLLTDLDDLSPARLTALRDFLIKMGNQKNHDIYESNLPEGFVRPHGVTMRKQLEKFIVDKYTNKAFSSGGGGSGGGDVVVESNEIDISTNEEEVEAGEGEEGNDKVEFGGENSKNSSWNKVEDKGKDPLLHILVAGFHHKKGNHVEFMYPSVGDELVLSSDEHDASVVLPKEWEALPFLALPDGAHAFEEDYTFFQLPNEQYHTVYGISCFQQVSLKDMPEEFVTDDMKRNSIQKSVCVLSHSPFFGAIFQNLHAVTRAYFEQMDFKNTDMLQNVFDVLNESLRRTMVDSSHLYIGLEHRQFVRKFGRNALVMFKLLMLERKTLFYSLPVNDVCNTILTLVSLFPGLLETTLEDEQLLRTEQDATNLAHRTTIGLPLDLFPKDDCPLLPYFSLNQLDSIKGEGGPSGYIIGCSTLIMTKDTVMDNDVVVDCTTLEVDLRMHGLSDILALTSSDKRFIDNVINTVNRHWDNDDDLGFEGSDDWVRQQFTQYIDQFLSSLAFIGATMYLDTQAMLGKHELDEFDVVPYEFPTDPVTLGPLSDYNLAFVRTWISTSASFQQWRAQLPQDTSKLHETQIRHPGQGDGGFLSELGMNAGAIGSQLETGVKDLGKGLGAAWERSAAFASGMFAKEEKEGKDEDKEEKKGEEGEEGRGTVVQDVKEVGEKIGDLFGAAAMVMSSIAVSPIVAKGYM